MPFTPFHLGPGGLLHAVAPRRVSFLAFAGTNVLVDLEPLYFMLSGQDPLHRFLHTLPGATLVAGLTLLLFGLALRLARSHRLPNWLGWQGLSMQAVALGALLGAWSHIALDSVMHADLQPVAPFSAANPLYLAISIDALHDLSVGSGVLAVVVLGVGRMRARRST